MAWRRKPLYQRMVKEDSSESKTWLRGLLGVVKRTTLHDEDYLASTPWWRGLLCINSFTKRNCLVKKMNCSFGEDYHFLKYFLWKYKHLRSKIAHDAIVGYWGLISLTIYLVIVLMKDFFFITDYIFEFITFVYLLLM